jgi:hypothetical protein
MHILNRKKIDSNAKDLWLSFHSTLLRNSSAIEKFFIFNLKYFKEITKNVKDRLAAV